MPWVLEMTPVRGAQVAASSNPRDAQPLREALDVSGYDGFDLQLGVTALTGTNPSLTVEIITSMQNSADDESWLLVDAFPAVGAVRTYKMMTKDRGFLQFIRWRVQAFTGTANPTAIFWIRGIGRRYGA